MPTFIIQASYTQDAIKGLIKSAAGRRAVIAGLVEKAGGKLKDMYMTTGDYDVVAIADMPDGSNAMAVNMAIAASGAAGNFRTIRGWSPEEFEDIAKQAAGLVGTYSPPGG